MDELRKVLEDLGISLNNIDFYQTAFTHRSFLNESKAESFSNERMEFLGDAVLQFIVSSFLYQTKDKAEEGELTNLRAYIVKTDSLAKGSKALDLGRFLKLSRGEELTGGRENTQLLANTFEALLGAIYLDLGIEKAKILVEKVLIPLFETEIKEGAPKDFKSQLQELVQSKFQTSPKYRILETQGPDHAKRFTVGVFVTDTQYGQGEGPNKQAAEEQSAQEAVEKLMLPDNI